MKNVTLFKVAFLLLVGWVLVGLEGCASNPEGTDNPAAVYDASGIDVPDVILNRKRVFVKPATGGADDVFAALKDDKHALDAAEEDKENMRAFMLLSNRSGARIVVHKMQGLL